jgi:F0F1-type ATP synthase assembly protein I
MADTEEGKDSGEDREKESGKKAPKTYLGKKIQNAAMMSTANIIIAYPLVGFGVGWLLVRYLHFPDWVMVVTMILGLVQGIREILNISRRMGDN